MRTSSCIKVMDADGSSTSTRMNSVECQIGRHGPRGKSPQRHKPSKSPLGRRAVLKRKDGHIQVERTAATYLAVLISAAIDHLFSGARTDHVASDTFDLDSRRRRPYHPLSFASFILNFLLVFSLSTDSHPASHISRANNASLGGDTGLPRIAVET